MRIRKISQSAAIPGKIVNSPSDSTTETYSCNYINDVSVVVSPTEPTGNNRKKVWMQKGKNLFNKNDTQIANNLGKYQLNGIEKSNSNYTYLKLSYKEEKQLTYSGVHISKENDVVIFNFYNDITFLSQSILKSNSGTITIPSTCNNFTFSFPYADKETIQIESGNISTEYEEYIEPKIYVKNDNDVYEEFMKWN